MFGSNPLRRCAVVSCVLGLASVAGAAGVVKDTGSDVASAPVSKAAERFNVLSGAAGQASTRLVLVEDSVVQVHDVSSNRVVGAVLVEAQFSVPMFESRRTIDTPAGPVEASLSVSAVAYRAIGQGGDEFISTIRIDESIEPAPGNPCHQHQLLLGALNGTRLIVTSTTGQDLDDAVQGAVHFARPFLMAEGMPLEDGGPGMILAGDPRLQACLRGCAAAKAAAYTAAGNTLTACLEEAQYLYVLCLAGCCFTGNPVAYAVCAAACIAGRSGAESNCIATYNGSIATADAAYTACVASCRIRFPSPVPAPAPGGSADPL